MISDVIRIENSVDSDLEGAGPRTEPQRDRAETPNEGTANQECIAALLPPCRVRKLSANDETAAKKMRGGADRQTAPLGKKERPSEGGQRAQDVCEAQLPPNRVRKLNSHDVSVENEKRKYNRKRNLDQQLDGGQKRICFRINKQLDDAAGPARDPAQQPHLRTLSRNAALETDVPGPPPEVLGPGFPLSAGSGREGQHQGTGHHARAVPAEPVSGACSHAL